MISIVRCWLSINLSLIEDIVASFLFQHFYFFFLFTFLVMKNSTFFSLKLNFIQMCENYWVQNFVIGKLPGANQFKFACSKEIWTPDEAMFLNQTNRKRTFCGVLEMSHSRSHFHVHYQRIDDRYLIKFKAQILLQQFFPSASPGNQKKKFGCTWIYSHCSFLIF